jgi:hypothetical protein
VEAHVKGIAKVHRKFVGKTELSPLVRVQAKLHELADKKLKKRQEQSTDAEEALHKAAENKFKRYQKQIRERERTLGLSLKKIRVVRLPGKLEGKLEGGTWKIPLFTSETIVQNGEMASFADVIAPYTLIQARNTINTEVPFQVNIREELRRCGLLNKSGNVGVLQGLLWMWGGGRDDDETAAPNVAIGTLASEKNLQGSVAFPENLLKRCEYRDDMDCGILIGDSQLHVRYSTFSREHEQRIEKSVLLPGLPDKLGVQFILLTNADKVILTTIGTVSKSSLNDRMEVAEQEAGTAIWENWNNFIHEEVRKGVTIRFLFTRSA